MTTEWSQRWPNFTEAEVSCPHCNVCHIDDQALDKLQALRDVIGPLTINSAFRCQEHNEAVGGASQSRHLFGDAFDISTKNVGKDRLFAVAVDVGFTGFGFYNSFLHVDTWKPRTWGTW